MRSASYLIGLQQLGLVRFLITMVSKGFFRTWMRLKLWRFIRPFVSVKEPQTWVFMGGCYNSGTTILRDMLGSHPEVASLPREGVRLTDAFPDLEQNGWARMWHRNENLMHLKDKQDPHSIAKTAMRDWSLWWQRKATVYLEKSIVHGAWMPTLQQGFNNTKFIGVVRNGYCVCEGIQRRAKPSGIARDTLGTSEYPLCEAGKQWVFSNKILMQHSDLVDHYFEIRYEELVADPLQCIHRLFTFIGVDPSVAFLTSDGGIDIGGCIFKVRDQNPNSLERLTEENRLELDQTIGTLMTELGYRGIGVNQ